MRKVVLSAIAVIACGIAAASAPALARGGGGGGHFGGGGMGHIGGGLGGMGHIGGGLGGGGLGHVGGLGLGHVGGGIGALGGLGGARAMAGPHIAPMTPGHIAGLHHPLGHVHAGFHHRHSIGGVYDDCYLKQLTEPWLPYCY